MPSAILMQDVEHLGARGAVVDVSKGYLRNYLMPRKLAQPATKGALDEATRRSAASDRASQAVLAKAREDADVLSRTVLTISQQAGDDGRLFGSVTNQDIAEAIEEARGVKVDRRKIHLEEPIKNVGTYVVVVEVAEGVTASVKTMVVERTYDHCFRSPPSPTRSGARSAWSAASRGSGCCCGPPAPDPASATPRTPRASSTPSTGTGPTSRPERPVRPPHMRTSLLMYRYRRLGEARAAAREAGYRGAMFPWQSGSDGSEETQIVHLNPLSGQWDPDLSHRQRHVNAAIFYNVWHYHQATGDLDFLRDHGAEIMLEIARFWGSIAHYNPDRDRYEIHGVMGPDEFHEKYPGAEESGLRNNAYTNVMVAWICEQAQVVLGLLTERRRDTLRAKLGLTDEEIETWQAMSRKMYVPFHGDGIISQFEGYDDLEELDWDAYRARHHNIQRLDRILRAEGDEADRYKLAKQADTVLLFFLFSPDEISRLFAGLGYDWGPDSARRNIDYYDERTSHGSTLSYIAHAGVLAPIDPEHSWERFLVALESDVGDVQGGTTKEGIHLGVMAGTIDLIQRAYTGVEIRDGVLYFAPTLTDKLNGLSFPMQVHGTPIRVTVGDGELTVVITGGFSRAIKVGIGDDVRELGAGERCTFRLAARETVGQGSDTAGGT